MNKKVKEKENRESYVIKDVFAKNSKISINEIIKKSFLVNLKNTNF